MKDNQKAELVNKLVEIAKTFHDHQQLRARISSLIIPAIEQIEAEQYARLSKIAERQVGVCLDVMGYLDRGVENHDHISK